VINSKPEPATDLTSRAVNLVNCGIVVLDANQRIVLWNSWLVPRSARSAARVRERLLFEVFPELRGSHVESAVLAALTEDVTTNIPQSHSRAPFPLREAGSFDGARIDQAVSVTPFNEGKERFCLIETGQSSCTCSSLMRRAGTPAYKPLAPQSLLTTAPVAITQPFPIVTPGRTTARAPNQQPSPTVIGRGVSGPALSAADPIMCVCVQNITSMPMAHFCPMRMGAAPSKKQRQFTREPEPMTMSRPPK
jgi:hypothetical protein